MGFLDNLEKLSFGGSAPKQQSTAEDPSKGMFPAELEQLISIALADGVISDRNRNVLHKKAIELNVDPDVLDMVLDSRVKASQLKDTSTAPQSQAHIFKKSGLKKCPACGAIIMNKNSAYCPDCGYKVRNVVAELMEELSSIKPEKENKGLLGKISSFIDDGDRDILKEKEDIINSFVVPIEKESVLEFLSFSVRKGSKVKFGEDLWDDELGEAWYKKSADIITAARKAFKDDSEFMATLKDYAIKLKMERKRLFGL